jgi:hypothetical protein
MTALNYRVQVSLVSSTGPNPAIAVTANPFITSRREALFKPPSALTERTTSHLSVSAIFLQLSLYGERYLASSRQDRSRASHGSDRTLS